MAEPGPRGVRAAFTALALAFSFAAPARAQPCAVPDAVPELHVSLARSGEGALDEGAALLRGGRTAEAAARLQSALDAGGLPASRAALGWSWLALARMARGEVRAATEAAGRASVAGAPPEAQLNAGVAFAEAAQLVAARERFAAAQEGGPVTRAQARVNAALVESRVGGRTLEAARPAVEAIDALPEAALRARLRVATGLALLPERPGPAVSAGETLAHAQLSLAYREASDARDTRTAAHALGLLGHLDLARGESRRAATTLDRAVTLSAAADDPWRFRWLWLAGLARKAAGDGDAAERLLARAVDEREALKGRLAFGRFWLGALAGSSGRVYHDLADLLLARAKRGGVDDPEILARARGVIELSRTAEVEDHFRDPCIASQAARDARPEQADARLAVIHPLLLPGRLELLVTHASGIVRFTVPRGEAAVTRDVHRFREAVERPFATQYLAIGRRLHEALVAPIEAHLEALGVTTLLWVPDGALRALPFAALHDGRRHLAERYAVAVTPVAALTDTRAGVPTRGGAVLTGLTQARQGFEALPAVAEELASLSKMLGAPIYRDGDFTVATIEGALSRSRATAVHIASHGQFTADPSETFLLTWDGRLTLEGMRRAISAGKLKAEPLELLALSACQTAAGDDRAALGLAGVALSAGARAAVATLWSVNDESSARLVADFYRRLLAGDGKAQSLRHAQLALAADERFAHPAFWAPFIVIGNWR